MAKLIPFALKSLVWTAQSFIATVQFVQALLDSLAKLQFVNGVTDGGVGRQFFGHFQENFFGAHGFNLHSIMNNFHSISSDCNNFHERDKGGNSTVPALFRRVEIARPLRKTYGPTTALREWKVWTWPRFANATLSSAFERL